MLLKQSMCCISDLKILVYENEIYDGVSIQFVPFVKNTYKTLNPATVCRKVFSCQCSDFILSTAAYQLVKNHHRLACPSQLLRETIEQNNKMRAKYVSILRIGLSYFAEDWDCKLALVAISL